eukprot:Skav216851  [mRNA]  locus=scaffold1042:23138:30668:+ [translate_table: standard]
MPFLSKDEFGNFEEWTDDTWQPVNASGAFRGLVYAAGAIWRNLRVLRGASPVKYRIITHDKPHMEVAQADTEEECLDLLKKLNTLTASDVLAAAATSSNRKEVLEQMINKAGKDTKIDIGQDHQEFLSIEMLQRIAFLEGENVSLQQELEEARKALGKKDLEKQELQNEFQAVMAQQALAQVADKMKDEVKSSSRTSTFTKSRSVCTGDDGEVSASSAASASEDWDRSEGTAPPEILAKVVAADGPNTGDAAALLSPLEDREDSPSESAEMQSYRRHELKNMNFVQQVLHGPFSSSMAKQFWQLAAAPYRAISCSDGGAYVEVQGHLCEVVAHNPATETLVVGRQIWGTPIVELGFRGTVTEDGYGNTSCANWCSNLHAAAQPLQAFDGDNSGVPVHGGLLRIAGHSLGGALATLAAVDLTQRGWEVEGVVTFGSPKVGRESFKSLYQELGLHHRTVRFANQCDPVPWVPPTSWGFKHVVEEHSLGLLSQIPSIHAHAIEGSSKSYYHTLQDGVDGREVPHVVVRTLNSMVGAALQGQRDMASHAVNCFGQLKVDIALPVAKLGEGMAAALQEVKKNVREIQQWEWLLDMQTLIQIVKHYELQTWERGAPGWFIKYKIQLSRILEAAKLELQDVKSELAPNFVMLYLRGASFLIAAMTASQASPADVQKEFGDFIGEAKGLISSCFHLDIPLLNEILRLSPSSDDFTLLADVPVNLLSQILELHGSRGLEFGSTFLRLLKWSGRAHLHRLEIKLDQQEAIMDVHIDTMLSQIASNLPDNLTSLSINVHLWNDITDALLQQIASNLPANLSSFGLDFASNYRITDGLVQQIAGNLPQNLTSLSLAFNWFDYITSASIQEIAVNLPKNLTSLNLDFHECNEMTDASMQPIASNLPKNLTSFRLNFFECDWINDASMQQIAANLPKKLTSLSLGFDLCRQITDASMQQIAGNFPKNLISLSLDLDLPITDASALQIASKLPKSLTSLHLNFGLCDNASVQHIAGNLPKHLNFSSLNFRCCYGITDAWMQQIASNLPKNLTSLSLDFGFCGKITDASVQHIAGNLSDNLTSLSLDFEGCDKITDASVQHIAGNLPKKLSSLSLAFGRSHFDAYCGITDASLQQIASNLPKSLTSLSLHFGTCNRITDASMQHIARNLPKSLTSLSLHFGTCNRITDASMQHIARNLPKSLTSLSLHFGMCNRITDASVQQIASNLPKNLVCLSLRFPHKGWKELIQEAGQWESLEQRQAPVGLEAEASTLCSTVVREPGLSVDVAIPSPSTRDGLAVGFTSFTPARPAQECQNCESDELELLQTKAGENQTKTVENFAGNNNNSLETDGKFTDYDVERFPDLSKRLGFWPDGWKA